MSDPFYSKGLKFECQQCGYCCRNEPGYVFLSEEDLSALLKETGLDRDAFIKEYCKVADMGYEKRISIKEKPNNDCIFWDNGGCSVYKARPFQCRSYPFWAMVVENEQVWEEEKAYCPGIGKGKVHRKEEIEDWLKKRLNQTLISR
ncbi:MAG: YkgJ family cysteine cluster protein [Spirochaetales bacterium]|nr:YkgJ family cysteine cluster protein [Spirochaetales bacterium]